MSAVFGNPKVCEQLVERRPTKQASSIFSKLRLGYTL
jgi:hypothetical protein